MNNTAYIILIIALALVLVGSMIFCISLAAADWNFNNLDSGKYETNTYTFTDEFSNIVIDVSTSDVNILPSTDTEIRVSCYEHKRVKNLISIQNGTLNIKDDDTRKWYDLIFSFGNPKIDIYIPVKEYATLDLTTDTSDITVSKEFSFINVRIDGSTGDVCFSAAAKESLEIKISTGDIKLKDVNAGDVELLVSTGDIEIEGLNCQSFRSEGSTGDFSAERINAEGNIDIERDTGDVEIDSSNANGVSIKTSTGDIEAENITCSEGVSLSSDTGDCELDNIICKSFASSGDTGKLVMSGVVAEGTMRVTRDTGDVRFDKCDAAEIYIKTDTGDVVGTFLSDKVYIVHSDTGRIDVPNTVTGGRCEITTDTGKITIDIEK